MKLQKIEYQFQLKCLAIIIVWVQFCPFYVSSTHVNQAADPSS